MDPEQFAAAIAGTTEQRDIQVRQVSNGYIITGNRRFLDPSTGGLKLQQAVEAVADTSSDAVIVTGAFLTTGSFE